MAEPLSSNSAATGEAARCDGLLGMASFVGLLASAAPAWAGNRDEAFAAVPLERPTVCYLLKWHDGAADDRTLPLPR